MAIEAQSVGDLRAAEKEPPPLYQRMDVKTKSDAHKKEL
jgi:hypothetical protein